MHTNNYIGGINSSPCRLCRQSCLQRHQIGTALLVKSSSNYISSLFIPSGLFSRAARAILYCYSKVYRLLIMAIDVWDGCPIMLML